jgi:hypothetical protein
MKVARSVRWGLMAALGIAFPFAIEHSFWAARCPSAMTEQPDPETEVVVVAAERRVPDIEAIEPRPLVAFRVERDTTLSLLARVLGPPLFVLALLTIAIMHWGSPTQSAASSRRQTRSSTSTRA